MPRLPFERGWSRFGKAAILGVLLSLGWVSVAVAAAAGLTGDLVIESWRELEYTRDGVMTATEVVITHGADTRITAGNARHVRAAGGTSQLDLSGKVHIEFRGAALDASSAILKFRGQDLLSVSVKGSQARFSYQPEGYSRRIDGVADAIEFDAATGDVRFSGNTAYTDGRNSLTSDAVVYNIDTGTVRDDGDPATRGRAIIPLGDALDRERVPSPRQPDRSTAQ